MVSSIGTTNNAIYALFAQQQAAAASAKYTGGTGASAEDSAAATGGNSANQITTYDFTHMTPNEMQDAAGQLYKSGKISSLQMLDLRLAGVPAAKVGPDGTAVPLSAAERESFMNQPFNYIQDAQQHVDFLQQSGGAADQTSGYQSWKDLLATLKNLQGTTSGVDIAA
jgi:hypothetical protein